MEDNREVDKGTEDNREVDEDIEKIIRNIVQHYVWNNNEMFSEYIPTLDKKNQCKGSDYILSDYEGKYRNLIVDEKAAYTYVNIPLKTFALETLFKNRLGEMVDGWFIKVDNITEAYAFVWPTEANVPKKPNSDFWDYTKLSIDNILELEIVLVLKKNIVEYLDSIGLTTDRIREISREMYESGTTRRIVNGIKFTYGTRRNDRETPVNLLFPRPMLREMAIYKKFLTTKQYE